MRVWDLEQIVSTLNKQGAKAKGKRISRVKDLKVRYLAPDGYVGCPVTIKGKTSTAWIVGQGRMASRTQKAEAAEWLTLELFKAGGHMTVDKLIERYRQSTPPLEHTEIEALSVIAYMGGYMGFITDPYDPIIRLPDDHPLFDDA